jgi:hypothetical protein
VIVDAASPAKANMEWIKCDPLRADAVEKVRGMPDERNNRIQRSQLFASNLRIWRNTFVPGTAVSRRNRQHRYSITWSASNWIELGTSRPSALAVCRLMTNSNLVDCATGRSAGFTPLRIRLV